MTQPQLTLAAWYGNEKPPELSALTSELQAIALRCLGGGFVPYVASQIHATVLSLESDADGYGRWIGHHDGTPTRLDAVGAAAMIERELTASPLKILVGGYCAGGDFGFTSQGRDPFERSFSVQGAIAVAMGWPASEQRGAMSRLRRTGDRFGARHKYHATLDAADDDVFFRIGLLANRGDATAEERAAIDECTTQCRQWLAANRFSLCLDARCVAVVRYVDETLAPATTEAWPLSEWVSSSR
ncbi:MAG: hypothetical protein AB7L13_20050 [Acidimicrobiia bacterium]